ncbi:MAG: hypothetical protein KGY56_07905 [Desulfobacterales bacterium]|nr:hypothetical protein [Desulfobacterales bacterium]
MIEDALMQIASDSAVARAVPRAGQLAESLFEARGSGDNSDRETVLINLYLCLHAAGAAYQQEESDTLAAWSGLDCLPGGMLPLMLARHLIGPDSVTADLGAGNGLQGLLLQRLCPHHKTRLLEISGRLIEMGRLYQQALNMDPQQVAWEHADVAQANFAGVELIYLYRPTRPGDNGNAFYRAVAEKLAAHDRPLTIVSMADCLAPFLDDRFENVYANEFLRIFRLPAA